MGIEFIDLKAQQERLKPEIDANIAKVLKEGRYIMGPEVKELELKLAQFGQACLLYTSPSPRDQRGSRMPSSA